MRAILASYLFSCLVGYSALSMPLADPDAVKRIALPPAVAVRVSISTSELIM